MHPYLFDIPLPWGGAFPVRSYGLMIVCGFLLCLWLLERRGRRMGLNPLTLFDAGVVTLIGGIIGARLFYVFDNWDAFAGNPWRIIRIDEGGLTFYGGLMGGAAGLLGTVWRRRLPIRATLDAATSLLPLGHALGRVGCFLNGCCFGKVTDSWLGARFPRILAQGTSGSPLLNVDGRTIIGSPPFQEHVLYGWPKEAFDRMSGSFGSKFLEEFHRSTVLVGDRYLLLNTRQWSLPVHPTQLYEVAYNLVIFAVLSYVLWRRRRAGNVAWLYAVLYGSARFVNEFFRADTVPLDALGGLTIFQGISLGAVAFGLIMLLDSARRPPQPLPEPWQPPAKTQQKKRQAPGT